MPFLEGPTLRTEMRPDLWRRAAWRALSASSAPRWRKSTHAESYIAT